ncbi:tetratricopeptide repeat protein [Catalinimonas niigatensis]|uniref:tetratricopeptide repeat protein n=1 Tax=Catalinimonas niigatensis TaxID=1397264 RepID=UPI0026651C04|nr:tetratricopeptide repeat protein [Catalinimonas niigatensis]WPP49059.1 tetratricopeptide repeat protein [Catalinimonas niigatensis]
MLIATSCQEKRAQTEASLASVDLLRGDITLCGDSKQFGEVSFALSCDEAARETFDLGISLLHSFEYDEAEKAFVKVMDMDPDCAMAYWGVAMSNFHALWLQTGTDYLEKGAKVLALARNLSLSEREKDYLDAIGAFYEDYQNTDHKTRVSRFEQKMEEVYRKYQDDKEATIFYALALTASADPADKTYKNQRKSGEILEALFQEQPNHPGIAHYIIHNYDYPELAELALPTARRYAEIAPASAHAQHMPSHIFTQLGLWEEAVHSNRNSTASALCYGESIDPEGHWDEELHGMDYLVYAYLQMGENEKALEQYEYLKTFKKVFPVNFKVAYTAAAIPARIALENKNWEQAAKLELPPIQMDWNSFPWQKGLLHFARAMGAIRLGDKVSAETELALLHTFHQELLEQKDAYKANQILIQIKIIQAWIQFENGKQEEALALMQEARQMEYNTAKHPVTPGEVLPAGELLGDLLLAMNKPTDALEAYEEDLKRHPNRFNGVYGAAVAARAIGNKEKANRYFQLLLSLTKNANSNSNSNRKEIAEAKAFLGGA